MLDVLTLKPGGDGVYALFKALEASSEDLFF